MFLIITLLLSLCIGLTNRMAGGLLSQLLKKDMGDTLPRFIYGTTVALTGLSLSFLSGHELHGWYNLLWLVVAVLMSFGRGFGWQGAMSLAFSKNADGTMTLNKGLAVKTWPKFFLASASMNIGVLIMFIFSTEEYLNALTFAHSVFYIIIPYFLIALIELGVYVFANYHPLNIPVLGCYGKTSENGQILTDPPPSGELFFGIALGLFIGLFYYFI